VLAAALVLLASLGGTAVSSWMAVRATHAQRDAWESADAERQAREAEAAQRRQAEAAAGLLQSIFEGLDPTAPPDRLRPHLLARLTAVAAALDREHAGEPLVRARLRLALGSTLVALGEWEKGLALLEQALAARVQHLGPDHEDTLTSRFVLGSSWFEKGDHERALPLLRQAFEGRQAALGDDHPETLEAMCKLARTMPRLGVGGAVEFSEQAWARTRSALGDGSPLTQKAKANYAELLLHGADPGAGVRMFEEVFAWRKAHLDRHHPDTIHTAKALVFVYGIFQEYDKALPLNQLTAEGFAERFGPYHFETLGALDRLRENYRVCGQFDQEEGVLRDLLARWQRIEGKDSGRGVVVLYTLGENLVRRQLYPEAEKALQEAQAVCDRLQPDGWEVFHVRSLRGAALAGQRRYADAEPLLRAGCEGLLKRRQQIPSPVRFRLAEAAERLAEFYDARGNPGEAARWRAELSRAKAPGKSAP
jgi:tetratricopeptide (TPR) repeat protein